MTVKQRMQIAALREQGNGYKKIARVLSISENTIKSFCKEMLSPGRRLWYPVMNCVVNGVESP